jgi:hypothetical protein
MRASMLKARQELREAQRLDRMANVETPGAMFVMHTQRDRRPAEIGIDHPRHGEQHPPSVKAGAGRAVVILIAGHGHILELCRRWSQPLCDQCKNPSGASMPA